MRGTPPQEGGSPSKGGLSPSWGGQARGPLQDGSFHFASCHSWFTEKRTKLQKATMISNCLWRFMCTLSMHQFIEISICALENKDILFSNAQIIITFTGKRTTTASSDNRKIKQKLTVWMKFDFYLGTRNWEWEIMWRVRPVRACAVQCSEHLHGSTV